MSEKREALQLARELEACPTINYKAHAAELRRLDEENQRLRQIVEDFPPIEAELQEVSDRAHRLETQRDALLEALKSIVDYVDSPLETKRPDVFFMRISRARAALAKPVRSQQMAAAGFTRRPSLWSLQAREALELIAAPQRPDGTWNRDREACRQLAAEALGRYDDEQS